MQLSKQAAGKAEAKEMMKPKGCLSKTKAAKTVVKPKAKVKVSSNVRYRARAPAAMPSVPDLSSSGEFWQAHQSPSHGKGKGKGTESKRIWACVADSRWTSPHGIWFRHFFIQLAVLWLLAVVLAIEPITIVIIIIIIITWAASTAA